MASEAEEYEYDYSSDEDDYPIEDDDEQGKEDMQWEASQDNPNAAPMNYRNGEFTVTRRISTKCYGSRVLCMFRDWIVFVPFD